MCFHDEGRSGITPLQSVEGESDCMSVLEDVLLIKEQVPYACGDTLCSLINGSFTEFGSLWCRVRRFWLRQAKYVGGCSSSVASLWVC